MVFEKFYSVSSLWTNKFIKITNYPWAGQRRLYSEWLRAGRSGFESRWGEIFLISPDQPWGPNMLLQNGYGVFAGSKERPGRYAGPSTPSSAVVKKEQSYTSAPPIGRTTSTEPQCLYRASVPVQGCILHLLYLTVSKTTLLGVGLYDAV